MQSAVNLLQIRLFDSGLSHYAARSGRLRDYSFKSEHSSGPRDGEGGGAFTVVDDVDRCVEVERREAAQLQV